MTKSDLKLKAKTNFTYRILICIGDGGHGPDKYKGKYVEGLLLIHQSPQVLFQGSFKHGKMYKGESISV